MEPVPSAPTTFHCFRRLALELRLQTWEYALPDPLIIELKTCNKDGYPPYCRGFFWMCVYTSRSPNHDALTHVNCEARGVYLKAYKKTDIVEKLGDFSRQLYVDFSRDMIYPECSTYGIYRRRGSGITSIRNIHKLKSEWIRETELLAVDLIPQRGWRALAEPYMVEILKCFPKLRRFRFIVDGRDEQLPGPNELVDPSSLYPDAKDPGRRDFVESAITELSEHLKNQEPNISVPRMELGLLINSQGSPDLERGWDYFGATCTVQRRERASHVREDGTDYSFVIFNILGLHIPTGAS